MSLNLCPVTDLRTEVELVHLLRMRRYCHIWNRRHWADSKLLSVQCNAWHWTDYKITWVYVCLSVSLPEIHIAHDSDRSFYPIFLNFGIYITDLTSKIKFDGQ